MIAYSKINAYIDAEWGSDNETICLQILLTYGKSGSAKYLVFNEKYRELLKSKGFTEGRIPGMNVRLIFNDFLPENDVLTQVIFDHVEIKNLPIEKGKLNCNLYLFFSPKDLWISIGFKNFNELIYTPRQNGGFQIEQKRSLRGSFSQRLDNGFSVSYVIKDVSGWTNRGLIVLAQSLGISSDEKSLLDNYKSQMELGLVHCTHDFIKYSINDVVLLEKIVKGMVKMVNWLSNDILSINMTFTQSNIPMSQGSLVSRVFIRFLHTLFNKTTEYPDHLKEKLLIAAFCKTGLLKKDRKNFKRNLALHKKLFENGSIETFLKLENAENLDKLCNDREMMYEEFGFSQASIRSFISCFSKTTGVFNALVQGGRCINEHYWLRTHDYTADVDLASCYGTALINKIYPLGLPFVYATTPNQESITLGEFLNKYKKNLVDGTFKIIVSGGLNFDQDLIFSKLTSESQLKKHFYSGEMKYESSLQDVPHIPADFVLLRREISNCVITSDVLEILQAVCSSQEYKEFMGLGVVTATFWDKEKMCTSIEEWIEKTLSSKGEYFFDTDKQSIDDSRTRYWYPLKLDDFIGELVRYRRELKKKAKNTTDPEEAKLLDAKQNLLKLFINVFYGCTASPYFLMGNTVLADNITATARCEVWKLSKALNTCQSVTDGGSYPLNEVFTLKEGVKKPGISNLSDLKTLKKHRAVQITPLGNIDWSPVFHDSSKHDVFKNLDNLATKHLEDFWKNYGLTMKIPIEHKLDNIALKMGFFSKSHYFLITWDKITQTWSKKLFVIRGAPQKSVFWGGATNFSAQKTKKKTRN